MNERIIVWNQARQQTNYIFKHIIYRFPNIAENIKHENVREIPACYELLSQQM